LSGKQKRSAPNFQCIRSFPCFPSFVLLLLFGVLLLSLFRQSSQEVAASADRNECIILLHGLARTHHSMENLEKQLSERGFKVFNLDYPSTKYSIDFLASEILEKLVEQVRGSSCSKIHFVTHSMGGIVVRYYLKNISFPQMGRVVMLAPPNQGSHLVDLFKKNVLFKKIRGPAAQQLGTEPESVPLSLGPVNFELGVIAGNRSFYPLNSAIIPGPDDGIVAVERTKVEGMADFILLPYSHPFIMNKTETVEQILEFLRHGKFLEKRAVQ